MENSASKVEEEMCGQREAPCQGPGPRGPRGARAGQARGARTLETGRQREPARCRPELRRRLVLRALWEPRAPAGFPRSRCVGTRRKPGRPTLTRWGCGCAFTLRKPRPEPGGPRQTPQRAPPTPTAGPTPRT